MAEKIVVLLNSDAIGRGDDKLGRILMRSFIKNLHDAKTKPDMIFFVNNGVKLTTEGSELLEDLNILARNGTKLLSCSTCLDFFHLKDKLQAGEATNMSTIIAELTEAGKVIAP